MELKYRQDDMVAFTLGDIIGVGYIRGVASVPVFGIGAVYIVEFIPATCSVEKDVYPYSCIAVPEIHLKYA